MNFYALENNLYPVSVLVKERDRSLSYHRAHVRGKTVLKIAQAKIGKIYYEHPLCDKNIFCR